MSWWWCYNGVTCAEVQPLISLVSEVVWRRLEGDMMGKYTHIHTSTHTRTHTHTHTHYMHISGKTSFLQYALKNQGRLTCLHDWCRGPSCLPSDVRVCVSPTLQSYTDTMHTLIRKNRSLSVCWTLGHSPGCSRPGRCPRETPTPALTHTTRYTQLTRRNT